MQQEAGIEAALEACLQRLSAGEDIAACLARYPDHAPLLAPLLESAAALRHWDPPRLSNDARRAAYLRARAKLATQRQQSEIRLRGRVFDGWIRPARYFAAAIVVLISMMTGGATLAQESLPGDVLYPVKRNGERIRLQLTRSVDEQATLYLRYADRRIDEVSALMERNDEVQPDFVIDLLQHYDQAWWVVTQMPTGARPDLLLQYEHQLQEQQDKLVTSLAGAKVPVERAVLEKAISASQVATARLELLAAETAPIVAAIPAPVTGGRIPAGVVGDSSVEVSATGTVSEPVADTPTATRIQEDVRLVGGNTPKGPATGPFPTMFAPEPMQPQPRSTSEAHSTLMGPSPQQIVEAIGVDPTAAVSATPQDPRPVAESQETPVSKPQPQPTATATAELIQAPEFDPTATPSPYATATAEPRMPPMPAIFPTTETALPTPTATTILTSTTTLPTETALPTPTATTILTSTTTLPTETALPTPTATTIVTLTTTPHVTGTETFQGTKRPEPPQQLDAGGPRGPAPTIGVEPTTVIGELGATAIPPYLVGPDATQDAEPGEALGDEPAGVLKPEPANLGTSALPGAGTIGGAAKAEPDEAFVLHSRRRMPPWLEPMTFGIMFTPPQDPNLVGSPTILEADTRAPSLGLRSSTAGYVG